MKDLLTAGAVMASLEANPGDPSDLTRIVADPDLRRQLVEGAPGSQSDELLAYLSRHVTVDRRDVWCQTLLEWVTSGVIPILPGDSDYPKLLSSCRDAPPILFLRGQLPGEAIPTVAVVGSRRTSNEVLSETSRLASALVDSGVCVVSGLASGVDTAAHRGALAANGHTVAVLGTGLDRVYPKENVGLSHEIAGRGGVLSQFPIDGPPTGSTFLMRNHIIAGMSKSSIVMDASTRSGSRYEARAAMSYHRPVLYWAATLSRQPWAIRDVEENLAVFIESVDEAVEQA